MRGSGGTNRSSDHVFRWVMPRAAERLWWLAIASVGSRCPQAAVTGRHRRWVRRTFGLSAIGPVSNGSVLSSSNRRDLAIVVVGVRWRGARQIYRIPRGTLTGRDRRGGSVAWGS